MRNAYRDPTAWIAIANVDRERRNAEKPRPVKKKKEYDPQPPVDWHHVLASKHKKIHINKAWMFYSEMERLINEPRKKT